jgi:hypothetical protein
MASNPRRFRRRRRRFKHDEVDARVLVRRTTLDQPLRLKDFNGFEGVPAFFKESETPSTFPP